VHSNKATRTVLIRNPNAREHKEQILRDMYEEITDMAKKIMAWPSYSFKDAYD